MFVCVSVSLHITTVCDCHTFQLFRWVYRKYAFKRWCKLWILSTSSWKKKIYNYFVIRAANDDPKFTILILGSQLHLKKYFRVCKLWLWYVNGQSFLNVDVSQRNLILFSTIIRYLSIIYRVIDHKHTNLNFVFNNIFVQILSF